jgi:NAD(P)-dependent dehydrogenase (short-subunit alcohol dehydrogenase family)
MSTLDGARVLVTGAGSGIGAAIAAEVVRCGGTVAVNDLDPAAAAGTCAGIGSAAVPVPGDVSTPDGAAAVVASAVEALGGLTGLVNNVGIVRGGPLRTLSAAEWDLVMRVDCGSALYCAQAGYPHLAAASGAIVNLSSLCGVFAAPFAGSYNAAKAAVISLTQQLALEWGGDGIRANAIAPGIVSGTNFSASSQDPAVAVRRGPALPLGRTGRAEDIAPVAAFLLGDGARYMTGQVLVVDGGLGIALQTLLPA